MKKVWTGRYWQTEKHTKKISATLKEFYKTHEVHNKGVHNPKYSEPACVRFRRNPDYYLKELELNAKRNIGVNMSPERKAQIENWRRFVQERTGAGRPKSDWSDKEKEYLRKNWGKIPALEIALKLKRSFNSVSHKASRLGLRYYNQWN